MKLLCAFAILLASLGALAQTTPSASLPTGPSATPPPITHDEAVANEKKLFAADQAHDLETIKSIVADDFVDIARDGTSIGKDALLKEIPKIKLLRYEQHNFRVAVLGPFAYTISYDSDATMTGDDGKEMRSQNGLNSVWVRRDGRWQMLMHCRGQSNKLDSPPQ
ncbi:MAG TPA: nuclear transport factor 2 family protein [Terriglobales bacterium]|nr:nuclear transport factor 2 family protein [Terriglobales bacterium]